MVSGTLGIRTTIGERHLCLNPLTLFPATSYYFLYYSICIFILTQSFALFCFSFSCTISFKISCPKGLSVEKIIRICLPEVFLLKK